MSNARKTKMQLIEELKMLRRQNKALERRLSRSQSAVPVSGKRMKRTLAVAQPTTGIVRDAARQARDDLEFVVQERTAELMRANKNLAFLSKSATAFVGLDIGQDIYLTMATLLKELIGDAVISVHSFDAATGILTVRAIVGTEQDEKAITAAFGAMPVGQVFRVDDESLALFSSGKLHRVSGRPHDLVAGWAPEEVSRALEEQLNLNQVFTVGISNQGQVHGNVAIAPRQGTTLTDISAIETLVSQAGIALQRQQAVQARRESEALYRTMFETSPDGIVLSDLDGKVQACNQQCLNFFGVRQKEAFGRNPFEWIAPEDRARATVNSQILLVHGRTQDVEYVFVRQDGTRFVGESSSTLITDAQGKPSAVLRVIRDITARKEAEESLWQRAEELSVLNSLNRQISASLSPNRVADIALGGVVACVTPDLALLYLRQDDELVLQGVHLGNASLRHVPPEVKQVGQCLCGLAAGGEEAIYSVDIGADPRCTLEECKNAGIHSFAAVPLATGTETLGVLGVLGVASLSARDFSRQASFLEALAGQVAIALKNSLSYQQIQRYALELEHQIAERKRAEAQLQRSEEYFRALIENSTDVVTLIEPNGTIRYVSPSVMRVTGYAPAEVVGRSMLEFVRPEDRSSFATNFANAVRASGLAEKSSESKIRRKDGTWCVLESRISNLLQVPAVAGIVVIIRDVTQQKESEQALRESEERFRNVVQATNDAIILANVGGKVLFLNQAAERIFGYTVEEMVGQTVERMILESDRAGYRIGMQHLADTGAFLRGAHMGEQIAIRKNGERFPIEIAISQVQLGGTTALAAIIRDITERKRAEQALRESEERFRSIFENVTIDLYRTTPEGRVLMANPALLSMLGYSSFEELAQRNLEESGFEAGYSRQEFKRRIDEAGQIRGLESAWTRRDGTTLFIRESARAVCSEMGKTLYYEGTVEDITERKRAEQAERAQRMFAETLRDVTSALTSSLKTDEVLDRILANIERVVKHTLSNIMLVDDQGVAHILRSQGYAELGYAPPLETAQRNVLQTRGLGYMIQTGQPLVIADTQTFTGWVDPPGMSPMHSYVGAPIRVKGKVIGFINVGSAQPDSFSSADGERLLAFADQAAIAIENARLYQKEQDQLRDLKESQARLIQSEKMSALGRLTASIAHEINNPLQSVRSCLSLVEEELDEGGSADVMKQDLQIAAEEVKRIVRIVRQLREFYRPAREGIEPINLHSILQNVLDLVNKRLQHGNVMVERRWAEDLPVVQANPDQLKQVFLNLIINAADAMPQGGVLRISTRLDKLLKPGGDMAVPAARLEFSDSGNGMSAEELSHLFEPFYTTKAEGTGLGLAVSHEIIQALMGKITCTSEPGIGTTFTIRLPVWESES
jgi:PAS domain S-box-containing protein